LRGEIPATLYHRYAVKIWVGGVDYLFGTLPPLARGILKSDTTSASAHRVDYWFQKQGDPSCRRKCCCSSFSVSLSSLQFSVLSSPPKLPLPAIGQPRSSTTKQRSI